MNWKETESGLFCTLEFESQTELAEFVLKLAVVSDRLEHHADMEIRYNKLSLRIITHDAGKVTQNDWDLKDEIERLLAP